ncbi:MAG: dihydrofolate reductase [Myxococcota bacterium]
MISIIVAMARNRVIGANGELPWHLPHDLAHFKNTTLGKPIIMGRRTHESIGHALPQRENIVVTSHPERVTRGCRTARTLDEALRECPEAREQVVIGGASLYAEALPRAQVLYLTRVHADVEGDAFFPELDLSEWHELTTQDFAPDERHAYAFTIAKLTRTADR